MGVRGASTFPLRNRLPHPISGRKTSSFLYSRFSDIPFPLWDKYIGGDSVHFRERATSGSSIKTLITCEDIEESDPKAQAKSPPLSPSKEELLKSNKPQALVIEEEDGCPICLEEYDVENPKTLTKCEHHFHLACILEWMERSDSCPICDQEMIFDEELD